ncbi:glycoside hydrolase family 3 N-terminal domain-containing protein [Sediminibacillus halophilus]|uniref:Beta-glucosidase n=1 Tax=Sediminibacillus halophilus TaxID=482461 RepID=A0A1G9U7S7_9BACI|nr:glycoside hydrolase family 3 N-terminal domain-containing protein [Sediminibacillus halophilus]SDM56046.1 beta-glucosidase [Sediminibacillus halophilus]
MEFYEDKSFPTEERVDRLLKEMTLKEKVGQLNQKLYGWQAYRKTEDGYELTDLFKKHVEQFDGMGALYGLFRADPWSAVDFNNGIAVEDSAMVTNMIQKYLEDNTRLGIPVLFSEECPHGHQALGSTLYPTNIGAGASWNPSLQRQVSSHVASELRARGSHLGLVSTLDIVRDPRWGRTEECFSEDPYLSAKMTEAVLEGMQGTAGEFDEDKAVAVLKHFAAQGAGVGGHNSGPALIGERELREIFLPPMKAAVQSGALACMAAYNEIDGVPCHGNKQLLTNILRNEWGYQGIVMADGTALDRLMMLTGDKELAAAYALEAGVDLSLWDEVYLSIESTVRNGKIDEQLVDQAVRRMLMIKHNLGLFDERKWTPVSKASLIVGHEKFEKTNLEMARQSLVLLKNEENILPLEGIKKLAVIGPSADNLYNMLGDYTPPQKPGSGSTVLDGIRSMAPADVEISYSKGCGIRDSSMAGFAEARQIASGSDVAIVVAGGSSARDFSMDFEDNGAVKHYDAAEMDCGENVDVADLSLGGVQSQLIQQITETGTPVVLILIQGRPHAIPWEAEHCSAILCGWYPGPSGGTAIAEAIFGRFNPSGKLPVSIPASSMQLPVYYNAKDSGAKEDYFDMSGKALFPFGHGLSYTTFSYRFMSNEEKSLSLSELEEGNQFDIAVEVNNVGERAGYEVVQLYIKDMEASVTQRKKELKGFDKIWLEPGESKVIHFQLGKEQLSVWNIQMKETVEPGLVKVMVGGSSETTTNVILRITKERLGGEESA